MAPSQPRLTPLRRGVGAVLVVVLLVGAILYYRAATTVQVAAVTQSAPPGAAPSPPDDPSPTATPRKTPAPAGTPAVGGDRGTSAPRTGTIVVYGGKTITARPFETVRVRGTYHGVPERVLHLERREGSRWVAFPLPTKTDWLGRFITYVEMGQPGPHWLRVVDPQTGVRSPDFVLEIRNG